MAMGSVPHTWLPGANSQVPRSKCSQYNDHQLLNFPELYLAMGDFVLKMRQCNTAACKHVN